MIKIVKSLIVIVAVAALAVGATGAYFSDQATVAGNTFESGTLSLDLDPATTGNATPVIISNIKPGIIAKTGAFANL